MAESLTLESLSAFVNNQACTYEPGSSNIFVSECSYQKIVASMNEIESLRHKKNLREAESLGYIP